MIKGQLSGTDVRVYHRKHVFFCLLGYAQNILAQKTVNNDAIIFLGKIF